MFKILILSNVLKFFVPIGLLIWALFMPKIAGYVYLGIYGLFSSYLFLIDSIRVHPDPVKFSKQEIEIIQKYHIALRFSFAAKEMSVFLNGFRWAGIPWFFLFLFHHVWVGAIIVASLFFITASISVRLDPVFFLSQAVESGQIQYMSELSLLKMVAEKMGII